MALEFSHGAIQWLTSDALNSTKVISGLGFTPKAIRFYWVGVQSNSPTNTVTQAVSGRRGIGFAVSATSRRCVGTYSLDNGASSDCGSVAADNSVVITVDGNGTVDGRLDISSFDTDGFTLIVDDVVPANLTIFYEVWGGSDIEVAVVGDAPEPAATGTVNYTVNGFTSNGANQVVMFAGVQSTAALNTGQANDSGLHFGYATSTNGSNNITICGNSDDASGTMDTDGYLSNSDCTSMIIVAGGNVNAAATLSAWGTNLFTLNWRLRATTNRRNIFMAIKGGSWYADISSINPANVINTTSDLIVKPSFIIKGISYFTRNRTSDTGRTTTVNDIMCMGTATSPTDRRSMGYLDENGTANSEIDLVLQYDSVLSVPSATGTVQSEYDINSISGNNSQLIVEVVSPNVVVSYGYLTFGSQWQPRTVSVGHPFMI